MSPAPSHLSRARRAWEKLALLPSLTWGRGRRSRYRSRISSPKQIQVQDQQPKADTGAGSAAQGAAVGDGDSAHHHPILEARLERPPPPQTKHRVSEGQLEVLGDHGGGHCHYTETWQVLRCDDISRAMSNDRPSGKNPSRFNPTKCQCKTHQPIKLKPTSLAIIKPIHPTGAKTQTCCDRDLNLDLNG